jgi:gluconolactonase
VCVDGLGFPEGEPAFGTSGSIVFVEIYKGQVSEWHPGEDGARVVARTGGGPNSVVAAHGIHGAEWLLTQNGGVAGIWRAEERCRAGIQKIAHDGTVSYLCTSVCGKELVAPNDLCVDNDGTLYFSDPGEAFRPDSPSEDGHLYVVAADGKEACWNVGRTFPNGVACGLGGVMWTESYTCRVMARVNGQVQVVAELPPEHVPDGLAVRADGTLAIATTASGGVVLLVPNGRAELLYLGSDVYTTNCNFDSAGNLYVTDASDLSSEVQSGRLWRVDAGQIASIVKA